ncbi:Ecm1p Ecym_5002 [Eremothecium cymbalariae DBVPG|uniref:Shuttling pre-60S factor ECM1 n=1 Tax=Eremothecium cymbalariae (strain CBS 270.75 / DBVPG 7215 / KCTC 17166 / NRRL Y-17582) TaxID=931890 RepID=I6NCL3_ERECY|nr:hypothetical protein Ecym_5002 [Eremothecium cymbalariae DBVPG\
MAKGISKRSRAARRNEVAEPEARALEKLPRAEKTDITGALIRTASKNEALLTAKINKRRTKGKSVGKKQLTTMSPLTSLNKERFEKGLNFSSRLNGKIEKAVSRAKYVQSARKAGWDSTNNSIRKELAVMHNSERLGLEHNSSTIDIDVEQEDLEKDASDVVVESSNAFNTLANDVEA